MGIIDRADRMAQRMDGAEALLEGGRAHHRGNQHMRPGREVRAVLYGGWQPLLDQAHAFQRHAIGHRVKAPRAIGFKVVRQCIHAGRGGQVGGQADRQLRIEDDDTRHQLGVKNKLLAACVFIGDDRHAADLGAGAGGRRYGDHWRDGIGVGAQIPVLAVLEIPDRAALPDHQGGRLGDIYGAAAAKGNNAVMAAGAVDGNGIGHIGADRVGGDLGEGCCRQARSGILRQRVLHHFALGQAGVGNEKRPRDANLAASVRQFVDAAITKTDCCRIAPVSEQSPANADIHSPSNFLVWRETIKLGA